MIMSCGGDWRIAAAHKRRVDLWHRTGGAEAEVRAPRWFGQHVMVMMGAQRDAGAVVSPSGGARAAGSCSREVMVSLW